MNDHDAVQTEQSGMTWADVSEQEKRGLDEVFGPKRNSMEPEPFDPGCKRFASEMEYLDSYLEDGQSRAEYVILNDGTYNPENGHFLCDTCYIKAGMPTSPWGWVCP